MKKQLTIFLLLLLTLGAAQQHSAAFANASSTQAAAPAARSIYIFGDSWAHQMSIDGDPTPFDAAITTREFDSFVTVHHHAISGSTVAEWAADNNGSTTALINAIQADTTTSPIVFFTLGGNDLLGGATAEQITASMNTLLTLLEASRPDLHVVLGAYDILNPDVNSFICNAGLMAAFGSNDPTTVNTAFMAIYEGSVGITNNFARVTPVNTFGSLQGTPGNPTLSEWSPVEYLADCIHLNENGYTIYLNTVFDAQLTPMLCGDPFVTASGCPARTTAFVPMVTLAEGR